MEPKHIGTSAISEVNDLYDLIDLYANLDRNADGLLGPREVAAAEIKAGDIEGLANSSHGPRPDGFLQPWEVMQLQHPHFTPGQIERVRSINRAGKAFEDIPSLPTDIMIRGITYLAKTPLTFEHHLSDDPKTPLKLESQTGFSRIKCKGILATTSSIPDIPDILFPEKSSVEFDYWREGPDELYVMPTVTLGNDALIHGIACRKGTRLSFHKGALSSLSSPEGFLIRGIELTEAQFADRDITLSRGVLRRPTRLAISETRKLLFQGKVEFSPRDKVKRGTLAESIKSPYRAAMLMPGTIVGFLENGALIEDTRECFSTLFPNMILSGSPAQGDMLDSILNLSPLSRPTLANIRALRIAPDACSPLDAPACANPLNATLNITRNNFHDTSTGAITHEAAHVRHHALERDIIRRIAAATRHLDPTRPEDAAADAAIAQKIWEQSFDAKWSRASGYSFSFTLSELAAAMGAQMRYGKGVVEHGTEAPSEGFVSHYARMNIWEHVATHVQFITDNPETYRELIDPDSAHYRNHLDRTEMASRYRQQLDLLFRYGFIRERTYRKIVPTHPSLAAFCANLNCP